MPTLINSFSLSSTVGIGTNNPNKNLTVIGEVSASRNLFVGGDLNVYGTLFTYGSSIQLSSTNLEVGDPMIYIANNNTATNNPFDIGIVGHFNDSTASPPGNGYQHTGFVRNRLTGNWTLFSGVTTEPSDNNTINWNDPKFKLDTITANLSGGSFITRDLTAINIIGVAEESVFTDGTNLTGNGNNTLTLNYTNGIFGNSGKYVLSGGNVGIGTATPNRALTVVGDISARGEIIAQTGYGQTIYIGGDNAGNDAEIGSLTPGLSTISFWNRSEGKGMTIGAANVLASNRVGIGGVLTPLTPLDVNGPVQVRPQNLTADYYGNLNGGAINNITAVSGLFLSGAYMIFPGTVGMNDWGILRQIGSPADSYMLALDLFDNADGSNGQGFAIRNIESASVNPAASSIQTNFIVDVTGNVGIGTASPNRALTVVGDISATGSLVASNVGIGTASPNRALTVVGDISATGSLVAGSNWNNQTTNYVIQDSDCGGIVALSSGGVTALSASIPNNNFRAGYQTSITRLGTGTVRISAAPGVSLRQAYNLTFLSAQYSVATLTYSGNPTVGWLLFGDLA